MSAHQFTQDPPATGNSGSFTIYEKLDPIVLPKFGEWPTFWAPMWLRNGREVGAYFTGIVNYIPEHCALLTMKEEHIAGASHALVEGGMVVRQHSGSDGEVTLEVRDQNYEFVEATA